MSNNIFDGIPPTLPEELISILVDTDHVKIERILSKGHASGDGWYDQDTNEWVVVLKGAATVSFENGRAENLAPGDYLNIPSHRRHQVTWTDPTTETVWLAVHY